MQMASALKQVKISPFLGFVNKVKPLKMGSILLNHAVQFNGRNDYCRDLWNRSQLRICVDGAANMLLKAVHGTNKQGSIVPISPTIVCGDMDSLSMEARNAFKVPFVELPDQNFADLEKTLMMFNQCNEINTDIDVVYIICILGRRFDHTINIIHTLIKHANQFSFPMFIVTDSDVLFTVGPNVRNIIEANDCRNCGIYCGVVPFCGPTTITSKGLKYEMDNSLLELGKTSISTSNQFKDNNNKIFELVVDKHSVVIINHTFMKDNIY
ncbi:hypothetical protein ACOME3_005895 [Neoechinorhynchus agilis]